MKKRHSVQNNVKKFYKMVKTGQVIFDCPFQRDEDQWTNVQKSKLIRAILTDYSIPPVYSVGIQNEDKQEMVYSILDGKQRLTSLIEYIDGKFSLSPKLDELEFEGKEYVLKNKKFDKLPTELQDAIYDYSLNMVYYVYLSDDELAEMMDMLNNGTPMSRQQKATPSMGISSAFKMQELKKHNFFIINAALSRNQHVRAEDLEILTQAMMIIDPNYELTSFAGSKMDEYSAMLKQGKEYMFDEMKLILDYVHTALDFYSDKLVMKKTVLPIVLAIGKQAMDEDLHKDMFLEWVQQFKLSIENRGKIKINYHEYMGTGSFSRNKLHGRLNAARKHYEIFVRNNRNNITE